jgi:hypothetical protein
LLLTGATLTASSWPDASYEVPSGGYGVWVHGNARGGGEEGSFSATVRLFTNTLDVVAACAYAINYPPLGRYLGRDDIKFTGTPPFHLTLASSSTVLPRAELPHTYVYNIPLGETLVAFHDMSLATGVVLGLPCQPLPGLISLTGPEELEEFNCDVAAGSIGLDVDLSCMVEAGSISLTGPGQLEEFSCDVEAGSIGLDVDLSCMVDAGLIGLDVDLSCMVEAGSVSLMAPGQLEEFSCDVEAGSISLTEWQLEEFNCNIEAGSIGLDVDLSCMVAAGSIGLMEPEGLEEFNCDVEAGLIGLEVDLSCMVDAGSISLMGPGQLEEFNCDIEAGSIGF